jgi:hypothetical protein
MSPDSTAQVLAVLTIPPSLESQFVDWLLGLEFTAGFSSVAINGHGARHDHLSIAEQVVGRQRRLQFQVALDRIYLDEFLCALAGEFATADVHYWVMSLLETGSLGLPDPEPEPAGA